MTDEQCSSSGDSADDYHTCDEDEDEDDDEKSGVPRAASPSSSSSEDGRDPSYYYHTSDEDEDEADPLTTLHNEDRGRKEREEFDVLGAAPVVTVRTETHQLHTRSVTGFVEDITTFYPSGLEQCVQKMLQSCEQSNTQFVPPGSQQAEEALAVASGTDLRDIDQNVQGLLQPQRRRQFDSSKSQLGDQLAVTLPHNRQCAHTTAQDEDTVAIATGNVSTGRHAGTLVQLNVSLTQQQFGDVTVENATNVNQSFGGNQNISKTIDEERKDTPPSRAAIINKRTVSLAHCWNKGMVKTAALTRAMDKLDGGGRWLTIKGNPGEGKTTVGYMVLEELHRCGRQVYEVRSPAEFSEVISTCPRPVIMLDDVFGNLEFDQAKWSNWESVVSPLLKEREHKSHDQNNDTHYKDVTVILIGRDYVLNSASVDLGRLSDFLTSDKYVVCMDHTLQRDIEEKRAIWNSLSTSSGVKLNTKIVERILRCKGPHGFPHVCRLFITIFKESKVMDAEEFFRKPLEFLNLSMTKLFKDKNKLQLFKVMLRSGGEASMRSLRESDPSYTLIESCKSLVGSYLRIEEDSFVFDHPSIFDSVAYHMCSIDPVFVIEQCELSFIHERVRLQSFNDKTPNPESKLVVYIDKAYEDDLAKRFAVEISAQNFEYVLSHQAFTDRSFVNRVMCQISRPLPSLLRLFDRNFPYNMEKSFLALLTSTTSPELLKYVDDRLELTQDEVDTVLYAACKHAASAVVTYFTNTKESVDIDVKFHEAMTTPLMIAAMTRDVQFVNHVLSLKPGLNAKDEDGRTALHYMCRYGLASAVKVMVDNGADINVEDRRSWTSLCLACKGNHSEVVQMLIRRGARVDVNTLDAACRGGDINIVNQLLQIEASLSRSDSVQRALLSASAGGNIDILRIFRNKGASVNFGDCDIPPLHVACMWRQPQAVQWLLQNGAEVDRRGKKGETAIHRAAERGSATCVELLLQAGASVNTQDNDDGTALHLAARKGSNDCVEMLLKSGAKIDVQDKYANTSLHKAAESGSTSCVDVLLKAGDSVDTQDVFGNTPLHRAAWNGSKGSIDLLLKAGATVNIQNNDGDTALHIAVAEVGFEECVDRILKAEPLVNIQNKHGETALLIAAYWGKGSCLKLLLKAGAETTLADRHGNTALHEAAGRGSKECVDLLLGAGGTLNTQNKEGYTAVHRAAWRGSKGCVDRLMKEGAKVTIEDSLGKAALHGAAWRGSEECVDVLLEVGEQLNTQNKYGNTALHRAALVGSRECVELLLQAGASVNIQNKRGNTSLHRVSARGLEECVDVLLRAGASVNTQDMHGSTALYRAAWRGSKGCVDLLLRAGASVNIRDNVGLTALHIALECQHAECVLTLQKAGAIM